uniref:Elicitin-like protein n=1 Tax=Globisporangium ultimum (strain ATCC 200006 / CBS 805.95 / DAOM BR144) TaxID=431595 RepID=K3WVC3_GLOUD
MKSVVFLASIATALGASQAADCPTSLVGALATPDLVTCQSASGFSLTTTTTITAEALAKFCKNDACLKLIAAAKALGLPECTIAGQQLYAGIINPAEAACKLVAASLSNVTTDDSHDMSMMSGSHDMASMTATNTTSSKAPTTSTSTPTPTSTNKMSTNTSTTSNKTTTTAPTPTPKASAAAASPFSTTALVAMSATVLSVTIAFM